MFYRIVCFVVFWLKFVIISPVLFFLYIVFLRFLAFLFKARANMDVASKHGWTPLHTAAQSGHGETARILVLKPYLFCFTFDF